MLQPGQNAIITRVSIICGICPVLRRHPRETDQPKRCETKRAHRTRPVESLIHCSRRNTPPQPATPEGAPHLCRRLDYSSMLHLPSFGLRHGVWRLLTATNGSLLATTAPASGRLLPVRNLMGVSNFASVCAGSARCHITSRHRSHSQRSGI